MLNFRCIILAKMHRSGPEEIMIYLESGKILASSLGVILSAYGAINIYEDTLVFLDKLWESFWRSKSAITGVGLALISGIAEFGTQYIEKAYGMSELFPPEVQSPPVFTGLVSVACVAKIWEIVTRPVE